MSLRWRIISVSLLVGLLAWLGLANVFSAEQREEAWWLPDEGVRLGLDLRGGVHVVLGPDFEAAFGQELGHVARNLQERFEERGLESVRVVHEKGTIRIEAPKASDRAAVEEELSDYQTLSLEEGPDEIIARLNRDQQDAVQERAMQQVLEVLRRRVDDPQTGIPESVITRQGNDRVLVEIPGVDRVPAIVETTGFLEFKIVTDAAESEDLLKARHPEGLPEGKVVAVERDRTTQRVLSAYLVPEQPDTTGEYLTDARVYFDNVRNEWVVSFTWSAEGAQIFSELTEKNIDQPLAIILDENVYSAPTIRGRISRQGEITGNFSSEEAIDLAVVLRAGALPIPITIEEERTIGPALGADSIDRGIRASLVGLLVIVLFAIAYYRMAGVYASIGLLANLLMLFGLMSMFEGTLTLPGIAGLVLTVGMAIDANVIIFERIREELRGGLSPKAAIAAGFEKTRWTILDANITTLITSIILFQFGSGPIKGFAVTLSVGILTSVFSALVITRLLFAIRPGNQNVAELSI
jgi:preprotein translocase subunit SecD